MLIGAVLVGGLAIEQQAMAASAPSHLDPRDGCRNQQAATGRLAFSPTAPPGEACRVVAVALVGDHRCHAGGVPAERHGDHPGSPGGVAQRGLNPRLARIEIIPDFGVARDDSKVTMNCGVQQKLVQRERGQLADGAPLSRKAANERCCRVEL